MCLTTLAIAAAIALWLVPVLQVDPARQRLATQDQLAPADRLVLENQLFESENGARATLALIFTAAGLLLAAGIIWRRFEKSREPKPDEQFARAVEQLGSERADGSPRTELRLGGIYALERLSTRFDAEYWPTMEVLTAYVRDNAAWSETAAGLPYRLRVDLQAVLAVLGRRNQQQAAHAAGQEKRLLDLRATDLRAANLSGSRLDGVILAAAHLDHADATRAVLSRSNLREASLAGATLTEADLQGASLSRANLEGARSNKAHLQGADLSGTNLRGADLWEANLRGCNLKDADLRGADLSACVLEEAILWRADLQDAVLTGAVLREAHLERVNLLGASGLTSEQRQSAYTDDSTLLPDYLQVTMPRLTDAPAPPTPARRRARTQRAAPASAPPPKPAAEAAHQPEPQAAAGSDNVVALNAPARRTRARSDPEVTPKKAALPKHRKPGLVKPA